ncbi:MAG TPA: tRNA (guanosine(46)-N7)-methyltransferase TrmB [Prevotellaceae bacterium]|nr:tRNA (guanosine(46)-N7)-methyltransferase TrmB [Prevotellaceae bacterium]HBE55526.1 tRNA (guanosine(46)-N7)-methyltransferase TrmB [Prevotellaceae bacterium]
MGKGKLAKFADMAANPLVVECPYATLHADGFDLRGRWNRDFFRNERPLVLELGCGRGEYTMGLARMFPDGNYIGVDIKGARMWTGAQEARREGMDNVGFLRANIEFIDRFFAPGEVSEVWLTFSDPQMKKVSKRLTGTAFMQRYRAFMQDGGLMHLKTDSNFLYTYTREMLSANGIKPLAETRNLYAEPSEGMLALAQSIQTYYESMWRARGIDIKYLCFSLPLQGALTEPEVDIPLDEYRSYSRQKRSSLEVGR